MKYTHKIHRTINLLPAALLLSVLILSGCTHKKDDISKSGFYFNTVITVTLYESDREECLDECFAMAQRYENLFSAAIEGSDIERINSADGKPVTVDDETIALLKKGLTYCELSQGNFDITIGSLSSLWNFSENDGTVPDASAIADAVALTDYHTIQIDGNTVTVTNPDIKLDLGGIAKGYIADRMKEYLNDSGITSGIINLGGNVLTIGPKSNHENYKIGIQKPFSKEGSSIAVIGIKDATVVSSGVYERCFYAGDTLYHHILNPATGYPYNNNLLGVTIICPHSVDGDGLSTTCFTLGLEDGMKLIESIPDTEAIFITDDYKLHTSSGIGTDITLEEP